MIVRNLFQSSKIQRLFYLLWLIVWCCSMLPFINDDEVSKTSIGVSYLFLFWIVLGILLVHIIFNTTFTWILTCGAFIFLLLNYILKLSQDYKQFHALDYGLFIVLPVFILVGLLIWKFNPRQVRSIDL
jgi:hypothetical protein